MGQPWLLRGDVWIAKKAITNVLSIPDGKGGRKSFDIPENATFTLVDKAEPDDDGFPGGWWVISFNGFTRWTSLQQLADKGLIELHSRVEKPKRWW